MPELSQFTMSSGLCSLILLASLGVMVASQTHDLQVTFAHPPYTTLSIKAQTGCTNTTKDNMIVRLDKCPMKEKKKNFPRTAKGVCQEDGATLCVPPHYRGASCITVLGEMHGLEYRADVDVPPNVTFYNGTAPAARNWTQEGNTSKMVVQRLAGVPFYRLVLKPEDSNKGANCQEVTLAGKEQSAGSVAFRAHWHQQVFPGCTYKALFQPWDGCGYQLAFDREVDRLQYVPPKEETVWNGYGYLAALGWWNFQREEQQSVKKPGPFYNKKNTHDFMDPFDQEIVSLVVPREQQHQWSRPIGLWPHEMSFRGLTPLRTFFLFLLSQTPQVIQAQETERGEEDKDEVQDLLLEEKLVEEAAEDIVAQSTGQPQTAEEELREVKEGEAKEGEEEEGGGEKTDGSAEGKEDAEGTEEGAKDGKEGEAGEEGEEGPSPPSAPLAQRAPPPPGSFVTITTKDNLAGEGEGRKLAVSVMAASGLLEKDLDALSVEDNRVTFRVLENDMGLTAEDVARKAVEEKDELKLVGFEVEDAKVEQKSTVSAVMFNPSEKNMVAAAVIVCGVMAALVVAATVVFFVRRHARAKAKLPPYSSQDTEAKDYEDLCRARMAGKGAAGDGGKTDASGTTAPSSGHAPSGQRVSSLSRDSDNGNNSPSSRSSTSSCEEPVTSNMDISTGHMVLSYMEDHLKNKDRLEQEWIALCAYEADSCATNLALKPENNQKNRYPDAVPYDNNRVVLNAHANVNGSDYINASPITDHDPRNPTYIATQGPLEATAADFWQLVWEQGSVVVVMLSRLTENGHSLCFRYWPEEGSELYHIYEVHLVSEHIWCDDYLVRSFYLKNVRTGETRTVTQFHFLSWPDSGTPASTKALLEFRRKVNKSYRGRSCPIIVHCSDGIGRTGTYCLIDMVLNRMAKGAKEIDIAATLEHIRDQRPHMVRTKAQFEFVLMAVAEEVHAILKALPQ